MAIRILIAISIALLFLTGVERECQAQEKGVLGLGVLLGEPTGVAAKYFLTDDTALSGALGFAPIANGLAAHVDYLWHPIVLDSRTTVVMPLYVGIGGRILRRRRTNGVAEHFRFGGRGVVGVVFDFVEKPIDVFLETAVVAELRTEGTAFGLDLNFGVGVRYYF